MSFRNGCLLLQHVLLCAADDVHQCGPLHGCRLPDGLAHLAQSANRVRRVRRHVAVVHRRRDAFANFQSNHSPT